MPAYSATSSSRLATCNAQLKHLFGLIIQWYDNTIIDGYRNKARQDTAYAARRTTVRYPNSRHNSLPSNAVDAGPYLSGRKIPWPKTPDDWSDSAQRGAYIKDLCQFYHFAGFAEGVARCNDIPLRWGGDWDRDHDFSDQHFDDLVHFEIPEE